MYVAPARTRKKKQPKQIINNTGNTTIFMYKNMYYLLLLFSNKYLTFVGDHVYVCVSNVCDMFSCFVIKLIIIFLDQSHSYGMFIRYVKMCYVKVSVSSY